jgi:hypothetical protein
MEPFHVQPAQHVREAVFAQNAQNFREPSSIATDARER